MYFSHEVPHLTLLLLGAVITLVTYLVLSRLSNLPSPSKRDEEPEAPVIKVQPPSFKDIVSALQDEPEDASYLRKSKRWYRCYLLARMHIRHFFRLDP